jgi:hypothetical protein
MSTEVSHREVSHRLVMLAAILAALIIGVVALLVSPRADAQTVGPQVTQFPGASVEFVGKPGETHTLVTFCPAGSFAISGGWSGQGAYFTVTDNFPSQLPGGGLPGAWTLTVRKLDKGPLTLTPYVTCLSGVTQVPE